MKPRIKKLPRVAKKLSARADQQSDTSSAVLSLRSAADAAQADKLAGISSRWSVLTLSCDLIDNLFSELNSRLANTFISVEGLRGRLEVSADLVFCNITIMFVPDNESIPAVPLALVHTSFGKTQEECYVTLSSPVAELVNSEFCLSPPFVRPMGDSANAQILFTLISRLAPLVVA